MKWKSLKSVCAIIIVLCCCSLGVAATTPAKLTKITVSPGTVTVDAGKAQAFTSLATDQNGKSMKVTFAYTSSDTKVGTINSSGTFTAIKAGTTTITATSGSIKGTAVIKVMAPPVSPKLTTIKISPTAVTVDVNKSQQFSLTGYDQNGKEMPLSIQSTWKSSDTSVGTIDSMRNFTGKSAGTVTITATVGTITTSTTATVKALKVTPKITKITGNSSITGQPISNAKSDKAKGFYAVDYYDDVDGITLTIEGSGFGKATGQLTVSDVMIGVSRITLWSDTKIVAVLKTKTYEYTYNSKATITVIPASGGNASYDTKLVGTIRTRPWGQCTWEVARTRLANGKTEPRPKAYSHSADIDGNYVPQKLDAIDFGGKHVGIILSDPKVSVDKGVTTYAFTVWDRNADWGEATASTDDVKFSVGTDSKGKKIIKKNFKRVFDAIAYYR